MSGIDNQGEAEDELSRLRARVDELEQAERRHVDELRDLAQSEARLRAVMDNAPFSLSLKDSELRFVMANRHFLESIGQTSGPFTGTLPEGFVESDMARAMRLADAEVLAGGQTVTKEVFADEGLPSPGGVRQVTKYPLPGPDGNYEGVVTFSMDITELKKIEQDLRLSEERFRDFTEASSDVLWELDADLKFTYLSERYYELTGRTWDELSGKTHIEIPADVGTEGWEEHLQTLRDHRSFRDYVFCRIQREGRTLWLSSSGIPIFDDDGAFKGYRGTLKDITGEIEAQQALRDSEGMLKAIVDNAPLVINLKDLDGRFIIANEAFSGVRDFRSEDIAGMTSYDLMPKEAADEMVLLDRKVLATGEAIESETRMENPDGKTSIWATLKFPVRGRDGEIIAIGSFSRDDTERSRAEEALRLSEERFRAIFDNSPTAIFLKDLEGRVQLTNKRHQEWFGDEQGSRIGKTAYDFLPKEKADQFAAVERRVVDENVTLEWEQDMRFNDGVEHRLVVTKFPVYDGDGKTIGVGTVESDVTEERRMEGQLRQAQKMEAVGQLTGGVAHEFNNLLMVIVGNLELAMENSAGPEVGEFLNLAMRGAMRGADLTGQLLAFSRKQTLEVGRVQADNLVAGMRDMLQRTLGETIAVETDSETDIWPVMADAGQVEGALLNLALNASDAMPQGGKIRITTSNQLVAEQQLTEHPDLTPGDFVKLDVADTGCGMSADILSHAFEPFFTTKDVGQGTGLGLSMVHGFVEQSGGFVEIDSVAGQGTCISIYLPRADD